MPRPFGPTSNKTTMYPPYIPPTDADFALWLANFDSLLTAAPATFGLTAPDAAAVAAVALAFALAYPISQDPTTRTPVTIAAKDTARANAEVVVRPFAVQVSLNNGVTAMDKTALGVTVRSLVPTPIPAPITAPELGIIALIPLQGTFSYKESGGTGKAKPFGSTGVQLAAAIQATHTADPADATLGTTVTKSPFRMAFNGPDAGQKLSLFARFVTSSGPGGAVQYGPWSAPLQTIVT